MTPLAFAMPLAALLLVADPDVISRSASTLYDVSRFGGATFGEQLDECVRALPASGGVCDATSLTGSLEIRRDLTISTPNVTILLGATSIRVRSNARIRVRANELALIGVTRRATLLTIEGASGLAIGSPDVVARGWRIERLTLVAGDGGSPRTGLLLENAREGLLQDIAIQGFAAGGTGLDIRDGCWSNVADRVFISGNSTGVLFRGDNANAWVFRSSILNLNRFGVVFDMHKGAGHGIGFVDGTHFEGNSVASVLLRSGALRELFFSDVYVEALRGERFLVAIGNTTDALRVRALRISGGYIFASDQAPMTLTTRFNSRDEISATLSDVLIRTSVRFVPAIVVRGPNVMALTDRLTWYEGRLPITTESIHECVQSIVAFKVTSSVPQASTWNCRTYDVAAPYAIPGKWLLASEDGMGDRLTTVVALDGGRARMHSCAAGERGGAGMRPHEVWSPGEAEACIGSPVIRIGTLTDDEPPAR